MSEMSARASRRAFCFGSCTMNGLTGRSGPVLRLPGVLAPGAGGDAAAGAGAEAGGGGATGRGGGAGGAAATGALGGGGGAGAGAGGAANGFAGRAGAAGRAGIAGRLGGAAGGAIAGRDGAAMGDAARGAGGGGGGGAGARGGTGVGADAAGRGTAAAAPAPSGLTAKTLLQTLQRARRPPGGTFAGSTRYTVSHDGQVTFTPRPRCLRSLLHSARDRGAGRRQRPI